MYVLIAFIDGNNPKKNLIVNDKNTVEDIFENHGCGRKFYHAMLDGSILSDRDKKIPFRELITPLSELQLSKMSRGLPICYLVGTYKLG